MRFSNNSENPATADRILQVTVNDGLLNSAVATATVHVTATNDVPAANNDTVITNVAAKTAFSISQAALLANDTDPEGSPVTITAVGGATGLASGPHSEQVLITVSDNGDGRRLLHLHRQRRYTDRSGHGELSAASPATITGTGASEIIVGDG